MAEAYDVVVVGGGAAGVAAAVGAAQSGARTLLIETCGSLGGAATQKCVQTYCGLYTISDAPRPTVLGVAAQVVARLRAMNAIRGPLKAGGTFLVFDSEATKLVLDQVCVTAGVEVLLHGMLTRADREGDRIRAVSYHDHLGDHEVEGGAFVDASGEGDLAFFGGASTRYGNHGHVNLGTLGMRLGGVTADANLDASAWTAAIRKARREGVAPLSKDASVIVRLPLSNDVIAYLASTAYDARDAHSISAAERSGREQAWAYLSVIRNLKGCENAYLSVTGPSFGTRESRHVNCRAQVTGEDVSSGARVADSIGLGSWGIEWHATDTQQSSFMAPGGNGCYEIPIGAISSIDTANLFAAGRCADGDQKGGASLRVMGTAYATGHAAGVSAAEYVRNNGSVDPSRVRDILCRQGALVDGDDLPDSVALELE